MANSTPNLFAAAHVNPGLNMTLGLTEGIKHNNEALRLERQGDLAGAERAHLQAIAVKESGLGLDHFTTAVSYNGLGEVYLKMNQLDKAEEYLNKALRIREKSGPQTDLAGTRDNLARLFEVRGNLDAAEEMRRRGAPNNNIACGNIYVSKVASLAMRF